MFLIQWPTLQDRGHANQTLESARLCSGTATIQSCSLVREKKLRFTLNLGLSLGVTGTRGAALLFILGVISSDTYLLGSRCKASSTRSSVHPCTFHRALSYCMLQNITATIAANVMILPV